MKSYYYDARPKIAIFPKDAVCDKFYRALVQGRHGGAGSNLKVYTPLGGPPTPPIRRPLFGVCEAR